MHNQMHQIFTIPYGKESRNSKNETKVYYDPDIVGTTPLIFVMPRLASQNAAVTNIPTVTGYNRKDKDGRYYLTIADNNEGQNYFLYLLLLRYNRDYEEKDLLGISARKFINDRGRPGLIKYKGHSRDSVNIVTPVNLGLGQVTSIETISTVQPGFVSIVSENKYTSGSSLVNLLSLERNISPHNIQVGTSNKLAGWVHRIYFPVPWNNPPIVFVTPWWKDQNKPVASQETINKVTNTFFEVFSGSWAKNYFLNWMAVSSNPHYEKQHVNAAFEHFQKHFPEHSDIIVEHRKDLEKVIYNGENPSEALLGIKLNHETDSSSPSSGQFTELQKDIANLCLDSVGLLVSVLGIGVAINAAVRTAAVQALIPMIEESANVFEELPALLEESARITDKFERAKKISHIVMFATNSLMHAGGIRIALTAIFSEMSGWQWAVSVLKILAQITAIVAATVGTDGVATPIIYAGWIGRITTTIIGSGQVGIDIEGLILEINKHHGET